MKHNHLAILAAVVFQQVLYFLWYSDFLFFGMWTHATGLSLQATNFSEPHPIIAGVLASAMFCYLLSWVFQILVINDWLRGLLVGALVGVGFVAPALATHYLYLGVGPELVWIDCSRQVLAAGGAGIILSIWQGEPTAEVT